MVHHLDDGGHAASLVAHEPRPGAVELDLAGRVRPVAELVLEALDVEAVARAVGQPARQEEAREPALDVREDEEGIAHRRRAEPLVPGDLVGRARTARADGARPRRVGAHVGATLLLRHRHATERAHLLRRRDRTWIVRRRREARLPLGRDFRRGTQRRHCGVRHRDRAPVSRLDLRQHVGERRAGGMRAGLRLAPRQRVELVRDGEPHELVPGRVKLDLVDAVPVPVVRAQDGGIRVGEPAPRERLAAGDLAEASHAFVGPRRLATDRLDEDTVAREEVVALERRRLIRDLVRRHAKCRRTERPSSPRRDGCTRTVLTPRHGAAH